MLIHVNKSLLLDSAPIQGILHEYNKNTTQVPHHQTTVPPTDEMQVKIALGPMQTKTIINCISDLT